MASLCTCCLLGAPAHGLSVSLSSRVSGPLTWQLWAPRGKMWQLPDQVRVVLGTGTPSPPSYSVQSQDPLRSRALEEEIPSSHKGAMKPHHKRSCGVGMLALPSLKTKTSHCQDLNLQMSGSRPTMEYSWSCQCLKKQNHQGSPSPVVFKTVRGMLNPFLK